MRRVLLIAVLTAALVPSAAEAQSVVTVGVGPGQGALVASTTVPARLTGYLTVRFSGVRGAGCAVHGLCGYSGSIYWRPTGTGTLFIDEFRSHRRNSFSAFLLLPSINDFQQIGAVTTARVQLSLADGRPSPQCNDAQATDGPAVSIDRGKIKFSLGGGTAFLLGTRCAGPLNGASSFAWPSATLTLRRALHGLTSLSLVGRAERIVDGIAITSTSTLVISFGRSDRQRIAEGGGSTTPRYRQLEIDYRLALSGGDLIDFHGDAAPRLCNPLGSCGLNGTLALQTGVRHATATVFAIAHRNRPWRDLLHALGLSRQGSSRGVQVLGGESIWDGGGEVHADLRQFSEHCTDAASLFGGSLELNYTNRRMIAGYSPNSVRTRCPGPYASGGPVATVAIPLERLQARVVRLRLDSGTSWQDDGYTAHTVPHLLLTVTRERVHEDLVPGP